MHESLESLWEWNEFLWELIAVLISIGLALSVLGFAALVVLAGAFHASAEVWRRGRGPEPSDTYSTTAEPNKGETA